jgi:hypothetical protein
MSLEALEEISDQMRRNGNYKGRKNRGWAISPQFERSKVARAKDVVAPSSPSTKRVRLKSASEVVSGQPLAEFNCYDSLRRAFVAVKDRRNISFELLNEITGAPSGYFQKIFGPRPAKRLGLQSFDWALRGLGIKAIFVDDAEALKRVQGRFVARDAAHLASVQGGVLHVPLKRAFLRKIGAKGGVNRWQNVSAKKRSRLARKAAKIRNSKLTPEQRKQITRAATRARWAKRKGEQHKARNKATPFGVA